MEVRAEQEISRRRSLQHVEVHAEQEISRLRAEQHVERQQSRVPKIIKRYIRIDKQY